jgi:hypothetical protein
MEGTLGQLLRIVDMCDGSDAKRVEEVGVGGLLIRKSIAVVSMMRYFTRGYLFRTEWHVRCVLLEGFDAWVIN